MAVLGPVEVRRDGVRLPIPGGKATELLVRLALVAGVRVRTERLIDDLWSDEGSQVGRNTLQSKVSRLRRALSGDRCKNPRKVRPMSRTALIATIALLLKLPTGCLA